jgi:hypothetical protein
MKSKMLGRDTLEIEVTNISQHGFWLLLADEELFIPFREFPWFKEASINKLLNVTALQSHHLYWPDLDVDLELDSIRHPEKYPLIYKTVDHVIIRKEKK